MQKELLDMESKTEMALIGKRVSIQIPAVGGQSCPIDGLIAIVSDEHPIASGWYLVQLESNAITPHCRWTIPAQYLVRRDEAEHNASGWEKFSSAHP